MSNAISSALSTASVAATNSLTTNAPQAAQQPPQPATGAPAYRVTLTEAQQVYNLYNQGEPVSLIASSLSLSVSEVNNYLGITQGGS